MTDFQFHTRIKKERRKEWWARFIFSLECRLALMKGLLILKA